MSGDVGMGEVAIYSQVRRWNDAKDIEEKND